jgi:predicted anti-sigma-YlaC factor YlaD
MPSCKDVTQHSSDYLDRQLPWWQRPGYWLHLMMCVHCRRYLDQLKLTISTLGQTQEATPPEISEEQVHNIVAQMKKQAGKIDEK